MASTPSSSARGIVVHTMKGRARLRFPHELGNAGFFTNLATALARNSSVLQVRVSADTGSVLVIHTGDLGGILAQAARAGLFEVVPPPPPKVSLRAVRDVIVAADDRVAKESGDAFSVGTIVWLGLVGASVYQAKNGHFLPAGVTLLKHAFELMLWVAEQEPINSPN
jgi:hypothetical protein